MYTKLQMPEGERPFWTPRHRHNNNNNNNNKMNLREIMYDYVDRNQLAEEKISAFVNAVINLQVL
jgi:hypothetical protein